MSGDKIRVHVKNNRWAEDTFPNTPEGEEVFTITRERFDQGAARFPDVFASLERAPEHMDHMHGSAASRGASV